LEAGDENSPWSSFFLPKDTLEKPQKGLDMFSSYDLAGPDPNPMTKREVAALKQICGELPRNPVIIQIGAERGCSTMAILEQRPDAFVLSIDCGGRPEERENLEKGGLEWTRVVRALGRSQNIGLYFPWSCDLLYIDGDHRRPAIDVDIELWFPKVKPGGVIAFHDYIIDPPPEIHGRVAAAVDEWLEESQGVISVGDLLWVGRLRAFRKL